MEHSVEKEILDAQELIYNFSINMCNELIERAKLFLKTEKEKTDLLLQDCRTEIGTGSKFMHRGYYCPSKLEEVRVDNVKRGRIVSKPTKRTKISHRYYFQDDQMIAADKCYANAAVYEREYLFYDDNKIFGITFDSSNCITGLSAEFYDGNQMILYLNAYCVIYPEEGYDLGIHEMVYEHYIYHSDSLCDGYTFVFCPMIEPKDDYRSEKLVIYDKYCLCYDYATKRWIENAGQEDDNTD